MYTCIDEKIAKKTRWQIKKRHLIPFLKDSDILKRINSDYIFSIYAKDPSVIIKNAPSKSYYLVLTHSHQLDLSICNSILKKNDFTFIGLIGSKTKKIRFTKRLIEIGHDENLINKIECPIGMRNIEGKEPDVIAISIIARLLEYKSSSTKIEKQYLRLVKS